MRDHIRKPKQQKQSNKVNNGSVGNNSDMQVLIQRAKEDFQSLSTDDIITLNNTIGNQGVAQLLRDSESQSQNGSSALIQRALDPNDPSTYDDDGGHSYADHGAQTTEDDHKTRLTTGTTPSGRTGAIPSSGKSSKFASEDKHKAAFLMALNDLDNQKYKMRRGRRTTTLKKKFAVDYTLNGVGVNYSLGDEDSLTETSTNSFTVVWRQDGNSGNYKLVTMFPGD